MSTDRKRKFELISSVAARLHTPTVHVAAVCVANGELMERQASQALSIYISCTRGNSIKK